MPEDIVEEAELIAAMDSPAQDDYLSMKQRIDINDLMKLYDSEDRTVRYEANCYYYGLDVSSSCGPRSQALAWIEHDESVNGEDRLG